jgi:hypothetical protein
VQETVEIVHEVVERQNRAGESGEASRVSVLLIVYGTTEHTALLVSGRRNVRRGAVDVVLGICTVTEDDT